MEIRLKPATIFSHYRFSALNAVASLLKMILGRAIIFSF